MTRDGVDPQLQVRDLGPGLWIWRVHHPGWTGDADWQPIVTCSFHTMREHAGDEDDHEGADEEEAPQLDTGSSPRCSLPRNLVALALTTQASPVRR